MNYHLMIQQAKYNVNKMMEEMEKYPGGKELYAFSEGMTVNELIDELLKIRNEKDGDIPVYFRTSEGEELQATGLKWEGLTDEDVDMEDYDYDYSRLPSAVIVRVA